MPIIDGTQGNNSISGTATADTINALAGADAVAGLGGDDILNGGEGMDFLAGGQGNDTIYGHSIAELGPATGLITATRITPPTSGLVYVTAMPGDTINLYAAQKDTGRILRIDPATGAQSIVLDIADATLTVGGEQGFLGFAFHPQYATNGRVYVYVTNAAGDNEVREYTRSAADPSVIDPNSARVIITIPHPTFQTHNGGYIGFGPDGFLYIASGDGGSGGLPAQDIDDLRGKILRIDVNSDAFPADPNRNYAIPATNPFVGVAGADEIWALGLRNPWRMSFDSLTGDVYIADVGQLTREEVDFVPAGSTGVRNFGWRIMEGSLPFIPGPPGTPQPGDPSLTGPVFEYGHDVGQSITGGYVYRGPAAGLQGAYIFADFVTGRVWSLRMVDGVAVDAIEHTAQIAADIGSLSFISSFGVDAAGRLYAVTLNSGIYRLDPGASSGDGNDVLIGDAGNDTLYGGVGADYVYAGADQDTGYGGAGDDVLLGEGGVDTLNGGDGRDYVYAGDGADLLNGDGGVDILVGEAGTDQLFGGADGDYLYGGEGTDTATGGTGNDVFISTGEAAGDILFGGDGQDYFYTGTGSDTINGGAGVDVVVESGGANLIDAGADVDYIFLPTVAGNDTVVLGQGYGAEVVHNFTAGGTDDMVRLVGTGLTSFAQVQQAMFYASGIATTIVTIPNGSAAVWLIGIAPAQLTAADFSFA
jgi:Ca2+-binding RTX toxin-like protein